MKLRGERLTETICTELDRSEEYQLRVTGRVVRVHTLKVVFENRRFESMTFYAVFPEEPYSPIVITAFDANRLPTWAIPWTVYLAWEVGK